MHGLGSVHDGKPSCRSHLRTLLRAITSFACHERAHELSPFSGLTLLAPETVDRRRLEHPHRPARYLCAFRCSTTCVSCLRVGSTPSARRSRAMKVSSVAATTAATMRRLSSNHTLGLPSVSWQVSSFRRSASLARCRRAANLRIAPQPVIPLSTHGHENVTCRICHFEQPLADRGDIQALRGRKDQPIPMQPPGPPQGWGPGPGTPPPNQPMRYG